MAVIRYSGFKGRLPGVKNRALPVKNAIVATDTVLWRGALEGMQTPALDHTTFTTGATDTVFARSASKWFEWGTFRDVVRSPIPNDAHGRTYYADGINEIKVTDLTLEGTTPTSGNPLPQAELSLGVPAPTVAPSLSAPIGAPPTDPASLPDFEFYVYTFVNSYGEEGPPSPPSAQITLYRPDQSVNVTVGTFPAGAYDMASINLYRSNTGDSGSAFQLVTNGIGSGGMFPDTVASASLGAVIESTHWDPPPTGAKNLIATPAGFLAASLNNELLFSEIGQPHAWPATNRLSVPDSDEIVALASAGNSIVVMTDTRLYFATGTSPEAMLLSIPQMPQACVSRKGVVDTPQFVIYPSPDGLIAVSESSVDILTRDMFDRDAWQAINPSTIVAGQWNGGYLMFYTVSSVQYGMFIDIARKEVIDVTPPGTDVRQVYYDKFTDKTYILHSTNQLSIWDSGAALTYTYQPADTEFLKPETMSRLQVLADGFPVTITMASDGVTRWTKVVNSEAPVRVPWAPPAKKYSVTISSNNVVHEVLLGSTTKEMQ